MTDVRLFVRDLAVIAVVLCVGAFFYIIAPNNNAENSTENETQLQVKKNNPMDDVGNSKFIIQVLEKGEGPEAQKGQTVVVEYTGMLEDGTVFDSTSLHGGSSFDVVLGANKVILGWELGLLGAKKGEHRKLIVPPEMGYGERGYPGVIPPNATLIFDIKVLAIK